VESDSEMPKGPPCWRSLGCEARAGPCVARAGRRPAGRATGGGSTVARCAWLRLHTLRPRVRVPGPRGAALLSACPQQAVIPHPRPRPQSLAGPVHSWCPGFGAGKRRAGHLRRSTHRR
jgi:hypothetical protein